MFRACLGIAVSSVCLLACDGLSDTDATTPEVVAMPLKDPVVAKKELFITDLKVVQDRRRTEYKPGKFDIEPEGSWSFARLMDNVSPWARPNDQQRSEFVMRWMRTWEVDQVINDQVVEARPLVRAVLIDPWKQRSIGRFPGNSAANCAAGAATDFTCKLSFAPDAVPFRLMAVVNRPDLRILPQGGDFHTASAGQGRFVFMMIDGNGAPLPFTAIFEFMVPVDAWTDYKDYHNKWHELGKKPFDGKFNDALAAATTPFVKRNAASWRQNGSALLQLRTNDVMFAEPGSDPSHPLGVLWEMREFVLGTDGNLTPTTTKQEASIALSGTTILSDWLNENADDIRDNSYVVPERFQNGPFLAASSLVPNDFRWQAPGVDESVRKSFAMGTCNGCHRNETDTFFLHVFPLDPNTQEATLSAFLQNELAEPNGVRVTDLTWVLEQDWKKIGQGGGLDGGNTPTTPPPPPGPRH